MSAHDPLRRLPPASSSPPSAEAEGIGSEQDLAADMTGENVASRRLEAFEASYHKRRQGVKEKNGRRRQNGWDSLRQEGAPWYTSVRCTSVIY
jgi:hypothetical protein